MLTEQIRKVDVNVRGLKSTDGTVYLSPGLQGRIFCSIGDTLIHKLDFAMAANPSDDFNNIGGNSLWPAPEGGPFAFNYPHGEWTVQDGINKVCPELTVLSDTDAVMSKEIALINAKGINVELEYRREVHANDISSLARSCLVKGVSYTSTDTFAARNDYPVKDVLLNAWTLEQFPGAEGVIAFGQFDCKDTSKVINDDFYGDPLSRITFAENLFIFRLGGPDRLQIGVKKDCRPVLIGAYDPPRGILIIRKTKIKEGRYINIADNDQKSGPFSTEDVFSIFNGAALNFFELETIAPMIEKDGRFDHSTVVSDTFIFKGPKENLAELLVKEYNINSKEIIK